MKWKHRGEAIFIIGTELRSEVNLHYFGSSISIERLLWPCISEYQLQANAGTVVQNRPVSVLLRTLSSNTKAVVEVSFLHRAIQRSATTLNCMVTGVTKVQDMRGFFSATCPCGLRGPLSWAWQECNRLLKLGSP